jgi:hypothetical protein
VKQKSLEATPADAEVKSLVGSRKKVTSARTNFLGLSLSFAMVRAIDFDSRRACSHER